MAAASSNSSTSSVSVTYTSTPAFVESAFCSHIVSCLTAQFPIRSIPFSSSALGNKKLIQSLNVRLNPLSDELLKAKLKPETRHLVQASLLERPFAHVFIVATADSDAYRTQIRSEIREWLNTLKETPTLNAVPRGAEDAKGSKEDDNTPDHVIVYVTPPSPLAGQNNPTSPSGYFTSETGSPSTHHSALPGTPREVESPSGTSTKSGMGRFLSSSSSTSVKDPTGGVLEKLKNDFGGGKRPEKIVHIARLPPPTSKNDKHSATFQDPTLFSEIIQALKQALTTTLEAATKTQEEEATKLKSLRNVRGWNPVGVFGKLDCLCNTFEGLGLYDDAYKYITEIEDLYDDCLRAGELTFFPSIIPTSLAQGEDSHSVLSATAKPYREMIIHSGASLWDLKVYLLSRRLMLNSKMGKGIALMRDTLHWIGQMAKLVEGQDLPPHGLSAFFFSVALDILHHCTMLFLSPSGTLHTETPATSIDGALATPEATLQKLQPAFHSSSSELLELALRQLDRIGIGFDYLPSIEPFRINEEGRAIVKTRELTGMTKKEMIDAVQDQGSFDDFYFRVWQRTNEAMKRAGRRRGQRELGWRSAALQVYRGDLEAAFQEYTSLVEGHTEQSSKWNSLESKLLQRQLDCYSQLQRPKNRAWVTSVVSLLRALPPHRPDDPLHLYEGDKRDERMRETSLFKQLRAASLDFEREIPVSGFGKVTIVPLSTSAVNLQDQDGVEVPIAVFSSLLDEIEVDDVRLCISGGEAQRDQLWLTSGPTLLRPGRNVLAVRSYSSAPGRYVLDVSQIRFGRVIFQYVAPKTIPPSASASTSSLQLVLPVIITIPRDCDAVQADLAQPRRIALDEARCGDLTLRSGRSHIERAIIRLKQSDSGQPLLGFGLGEEVDPDEPCPPSEPVELESVEDDLAIQVKDVQPDSLVAIRFPLQEAPPSDGSAFQLLIEVEYYTKPNVSAKAPSPKRIYRRRVELPTALPLGINVQDFFRFDSLLSKFSISTGDGGTLKIKQAVLDHAEDEDSSETDLVVTAPSSHKTTVVTPRQPAAYVFKISQAKRRAQTSALQSNSLRLTLVYKTLQDDAKKLILYMLRPHCQDLLPGLRRLFEEAFGVLIDARLDVPVFALTGALHLSAPNEAVDKYWKTEIRSWGLSFKSDQARRIFSAAKTVIEEGKTCGPDELVKRDPAAESDHGWRSLEIPVEVPRVDIVNRVTIGSLRYPEQKIAAGLVIGKPVEVDIIIETTFAWGSLRSQKESSSSSSVAEMEDKPVDTSLAPASVQLNGHKNRNVADSGISGAASSVGDFETDAGSVFEDAASVAKSDDTATGEPARRGSAAKVDVPSAPPQPSRDAPEATMPKSTHEQQRMCYEVQADFENWIVSGGKRSVWSIDVPSPSSKNSIGNSTQSTTTTTTTYKTFQITLVPLRSGSLTMPTIAVWPLPRPPLSMPPSLAHSSSSSSSANNGTQGQHLSSTATATLQLPLPTSETYVANVAQRIDVYAAADRTRGETFWIGDAAEA